MNRIKGIWIVVLAVLLLGMPWCARIGGAEVNWQQFKGQSIYGIVFQNPGTDAFITSQIPEFEKISGMKVRLERLVDTQMRPKQDIILTGKDPSLYFFALQKIFA